MASTAHKIVLSSSRDIPFNKLVLSQSNVRRVKSGVSIEELAADIANRNLLQGLNVRVVVDADGKQTGMFEVPAGGRRFRALELLVKQKRMAKTQAVPCVVSTEGLAEEDSLVENMQREPLHPLDQFRSFQTLRDKGLSEEEIAARFFVLATIVRQRLKLAAVSPKLLDLYAEDEITLEQLMAFTVTNDHKRQEKVWDALCRSYTKDAYHIKRQLTEGAVRADDRRALFVGVEAYETAGGAVMRDLFTEDRGGWLKDPALLDRLVDEKLKREAEPLASEGWKWISVATEFPYGHMARFQRLAGEPMALTEQETAERDALREENDALLAEHGEADELPDEVSARLDEIETALAVFEDRPLRYDPARMAVAGVLVSLDNDGLADIQRGFVRPEDAPSLASIVSAAASDQGDPGDASEARGATASVQRAIITIGGATANPEAETTEEDEGIRPLSDRLVTELTAHRTVALRDAMGHQFDQAFLAVLHALCMSAFYRYSTDTCMEITVKHSSFSVQAPGLKDTASAKSIEARDEYCRAFLPKEPADLWRALIGLPYDVHQALFAHCASLGVNAVNEPWNRSNARQLHADNLARALDLDMANDWRPTAENYLGRVSKARIVEAVQEAKGEKSAQLIAHLKKGDMAREAERLLDGTRWLPEPLRTPDVDLVASESVPSTDAEPLPDFLSQGDEDHSNALPAHLQAAE